MGLAAGVAVASAVIAVAVTAYAGTRSELQGRSTSRCTAGRRLGPLAGVAGRSGRWRRRPRAPTFRRSPAARIAGRVSGTGRAPPTGSTTTAAAGPRASINRAGHGLRRRPGLRSAGQPQRSQSASPQAEKTEIPVDARVAMAASGHGQLLHRHRRSAAPTSACSSPGRAARRADGRASAHRRQQRASHQLLLLLLIAAGGILLAALLGLLVARTALSPIARFTRQTETIAAQPGAHRHERIDVHGGDELARLASTFNRTLDALEGSVAGPAQPRRRRVA